MMMLFKIVDKISIQIYGVAFFICEAVSRTNYSHLIPITYAYSKKGTE